jgi:hypothetical protein
VSGYRRPQQHRCAHRVAERIEGRRAVGQDDLLHEGRHVGVVFGEAADMAFAAVAQPAL